MDRESEKVRRKCRGEKDKNKDLRLKERRGLEEEGETGELDRRERCELISLARFQ